jgi:hypothetical protein
MDSNRIGSGMVGNQLRDIGRNLEFPKKLEEQPSSLPAGDQVSLSTKPEVPYKKVTREVTKGFIQNKGVIESSKRVVEESIPDMKPGQVAIDDKRPPVKVLSEEVKLKSGITIKEDSLNHQVTISRNDGNGNPMTLAVIDDASLKLPESTDSPKPVWLKNFFGGSVSAQKPEDIAISGRDMKQIIKPDGTIVIEDNKHGTMETPPQKNSIFGMMPFGVVGGAMGEMLGAALLSKWHGDRYTITPDGQMSATHFHPESKITTADGKPANLISKPGQGALLGALGDLYSKVDAKAMHAQAKITPEGTIESTREAPNHFDIKELSGKDSKVVLKPFLESKYINNFRRTEDEVKDSVMDGRGVVGRLNRNFTDAKTGIDEAKWAADSKGIPAWTSDKFNKVSLGKHDSARTLGDQVLWNDKRHSAVAYDDVTTGRYRLQDMAEVLGRPFAVIDLNNGTYTNAGLKGSFSKEDSPLAGMMKQGGMAVVLGAESLGGMLEKNEISKTLNQLATNGTLDLSDKDGSTLKADPGFQLVLLVPGKEGQEVKQEAKTTEPALQNAVSEPISTGMPAGEKTKFDQMVEDSINRYTDKNGVINSRAVFEEIFG